MHYHNDSFFFPSHPRLKLHSIMSARPRFSGDPEAVSQVFVSVLKCGGRNAVIYDDCKLNKKSCTDSTSIKNNHKLLAGLHAVYPALNFTKSQLYDAWVKAYNDAMHLDTVVLREDHISGWATTMAKRVSNMLFAVKSAKPDTDWVKELPWNKDLPPTPLPPASTFPSRPFVYGYSKEFRLAWRCPTITGPSAPGGKLPRRIKEYCETIEIEGSSCIAVFKDGDRKPILGLTAEEYLFEETSKSGKKAPPFFEGTHNLTKSRVTVAHRPDRHPDGLASMYQQGKQILQICCHHFACRDDALSWMADVAKQFCENTVKIEDMRHMKTEEKKMLTKSKKDGKKDKKKRKAKKPADAGEGEAGDGAKKPRGVC